MSNTRSTSKEKTSQGSDIHQATRAGKSSGDIPPTKIVTDINEQPVSLAEEIVVEIDQQGSPSSDNTAEQKKTIFI